MCTYFYPECYYFCFEKVQKSRLQCFGRHYKKALKILWPLDRQWHHSHDKFPRLSPSICVYCKWSKQWEWPGKLDAESKGFTWFRNPRAQGCEDFTKGPRVSKCRSCWMKCQLVEARNIFMFCLHLTYQLVFVITNTNIITEVIVNYKRLCVDVCDLETKLWPIGENTTTSTVRNYILIKYMYTAPNMMKKWIWGRGWHPPTFSSRHVSRLDSDRN